MKHIIVEVTEGGHRYHSLMEFLRRDNYVFSTQQKLQQCNCSKLRETLVEMLSEVNDVLDNDNLHPLSIEKVSGEKRVLQKVIKLIDASKPVA